MLRRLILLVYILTLLFPQIAVTKNYTGKKILHVESYHQGYAWSDRILDGIKTVLKDKNIKLKTIQMDTKRNTSEAFKQKAALTVKELIESFKPDVVIASDDNASKYVIAPYFKNASIPFVFCGVNWDSSTYGYPYENVTGMEEVSLVPQTIDLLKKYARGNRIGLISADTLSEHNTTRNIKEKFSITFHKEYRCKNFSNWKDHFLKLQDETDMILFLNNVGISDWNADDAKMFIEKNIKIPIGTMDSWMSDLSLVGFTKLGSEQGEWAARTALRILDGENPKDIPIVMNKKATIFLNMRLAKKLSIKFPIDLIERATLVK